MTIQNLGTNVAHIATPIVPVPNGLSHGCWTEPLGTYPKAQLRSRGYVATSYRWVIHVSGDGSDTYGSGHSFNPYATAERALQDLPPDDIHGRPLLSGHSRIEIHTTSDALMALDRYGIDIMIR